MNRNIQEYLQYKMDYKKNNKTLNKYQAIFGNQLMK